MALQSECSELQRQLLPPPSYAIWDKSLTSLSPSYLICEMGSLPRALQGLRLLTWVTGLVNPHTSPRSPQGPDHMPSETALL